jgi:hypothetical protein
LLWHVRHILPSGRGMIPLPSGPDSLELVGATPVRAVDFYFGFDLGASYLVFMLQGHLISSQLFVFLIVFVFFETQQIV